MYIKCLKPILPAHIIIYMLKIYSSTTHLGIYFPYQIRCNTVYMCIFLFFFFINGQGNLKNGFIFLQLIGTYVYRQTVLYMQVYFFFRKHFSKTKYFYFHVFFFLQGFLYYLPTFWAMQQTLIYTTLALYLNIFFNCVNYTNIF